MGKGYHMEIATSWISVCFVSWPQAFSMILRGLQKPRDECTQLGFITALLWSSSVIHKAEARGTTWKGKGKSIRSS